MAKASAVQQITNVTLELSLTEAKALKAVLGKMTGEASGTARQYTQLVYNALAMAGINCTSTDANISGNLIAGPWKVG